MPLISIIMPAYNREATLERAIVSVLDQTFDDFELLIVDDGSTDATPEVISKFVARDARVRALMGPHRGVSAARNIALSAAKGAIFTYLDSDDAWMPNHLQVVAQALTGRRRGLCYTGLLMRSYAPDGRLISESTLLQEWDLRRIYRGNRIGINGLAHTRDLYEIAGGFDESMTRFVDWDFILKMVPHTKPQNLGVVTGYYFHHLDAARVSRSASYAPNRLQIALRHRLGPRPKVRIYGGAPSDLLRFRNLGLEAELHSKEDWLSDYWSTNDDVIIWHWSPWDEQGKHLETVVRKLSRASGLSFYLLPPGAAVTKALAPHYHRRFDFVVAATPADKALFHGAHKTTDLNPIDVVLLAAGATDSAESFDHALERLATHGRPSPQLGWILRASPAQAPYAEAFQNALAALGYDAPLRDPKHSLALDSAKVIVDFAPDLPCSARPDQLRLAWIRQPLEPVALATPHAVLTETEALACALNGTYADLRVQALPEAPLAAARTVLAYAGDLLQARHTDGVPKFLRPRICYFFGSANTNSTRKRCHEIAETLRGHFEIRMLPFAGCTPAQMVGADIVVFQRWIHHHPERVGRAFEAMTLLRPAGKVFAYDIDDYIFHMQGGLPRTFMQSVDAVLVSTPKLVSLAAPLNPQVKLVPNGIDANRLDSVAKESLSPNHLHVIAWSSDALGLQRIRGLANQVALKVPNVRFHFVSGVTEPDPNPLIELHPMLPIEQLFALIRGADLVLALADESPQLQRLQLQQNGISLEDFFDAKSEIKFHYAGLAGTPIVTEPRPAIFAQVVKDGQNGRLVNGDQAVVAAVCELLLNPKQRQFLADNARKDVLAEHTLAARGPRYREAFWSLWWSKNHRRLDLRDQTSVSEALLDPEQHVYLRQHLLAAQTATLHLGKVAEAAQDQGPGPWALLGQQVQKKVTRVKKEVTRATKNPRTTLAIPRRLWNKLRKL